MATTLLTYTNPGHNVTITNPDASPWIPERDLPVDIGCSCGNLAGRWHGHMALTNAKQAATSHMRVVDRGRQDGAA